MLALTMEIWGQNDPGSLLAFAGSQEGLGSPFLQLRFWVWFLLLFCLDLLYFFFFLLLCVFTGALFHTHLSVPRARGEWICWS